MSPFKQFMYAEIHLAFTIVTTTTTTITRGSSVRRGWQEHHIDRMVNYTGMDRGIYGFRYVVATRDIVGL